MRPWDLVSGEGEQEAPHPTPLREVNRVPDQEEFSLWLSG